MFFSRKYPQWKNGTFFQFRVYFFQPIIIAFELNVIALQGKIFTPSSGRDTALTMGKYKALSEMKDIREMGEAVALALTQADKSVEN